MPETEAHIYDAIIHGALRAMATFPLYSTRQQQLRDEVPDVYLFEIVNGFATSRMSPYRLTLVVAFRREYDPQWRDFELTVPDFHPPMLSLRLFEKNQARGIMATLAAAADFTLENDLTTDVTDAAADRDGRVSPVDVGIGMLVLSGLAIRKNKRHLSKDDYRFAGGAEGILTAYVSDRLERFSEGERQGVMKALLALCNLDNNQRIAEGKTVEIALPCQTGTVNGSISPTVDTMSPSKSTSSKQRRFRAEPNRRLVS
jgi:hypothetical protein